MIDSKATLSVSEVKEAVKALQLQSKQPKWKFTWEFPFLKRFYVFTGEDISTGESIDYHVRMLNPIERYERQP